MRLTATSGWLVPRVFSADGQGTLEKRLSLGILPLGNVEESQVAQCCRNILMLRAEDLFRDRQRLLV